jgi:hypothetical protein
MMVTTTTVVAHPRALLDHSRAGDVSTGWPGLIGEILTSVIAAAGDRCR